MNDVTREVITLSMSDLQRNRIVLQSEFADDLPMITGDRVQIQQVVLNLLRNASDAMLTVAGSPAAIADPNGTGWRRSRTRERPRRRRGPRCSEHDQTVRCVLHDEGRGHGHRAFGEPLHHREHHGRLWAEPNDGPGATFSFSIPAAAQILAASTAPAS